MRHRHLLLVPLLLALLAAAVTARASGSASLVVSQLYASGGNSGATYANDYVQLFNRGTTSVNLSGWTLQYASAASASWSATALSGTIAPGQSYLVQLASGGTTGSPLPTPDAVGTTNLAATGGKVAVVDDTATLSCGASAGSCSGVSTLADLVGYGTASDYEGSAAAPAPGATTAILRSGGGCGDTDANGTDFATGAPAPQTTSSPAAPCSGGGGGGGGGGSSTGASAGVQLQVQPLIAVSLGQPTVDFGSLAAGATVTPVAEDVTVTSNDSVGYSLTAHRTAFTPRDLPLGLAATAPAGGTLGGGMSSTTLTAVPIAPAPDLLIGSTSAVSAGGGDVWSTRVGFTSALPNVPAGQYTASITYTVIAR
ncbi:MAG TPA: lamin tail domain-containing protein [Gaiellaceae bacterium]|nr:lamin tail domain-containing protein [Gaiellaceae bacterium]